jgi:dihydrolipoamide dehydrogenase
MVVGEFTQEADLLVIGGGPGGYTAALTAAALGQSVTLVEDRGPLGGVCLHEGCIPSKALLHVAELLHETRHAKEFGLDFSEPKIDIDAMRNWKQSVLDKLAKGVAGLCKKADIEVIEGRATFEDAKTVSLKNSSVARIRFRRCIIAVGSRPAVPGLFDIGSPRVVHSRGALEMKSLPKNLLVIGGGYIGLELGTVYAALGTKVTVVEMLDGLLPGADRDLVRPLAARLKSEFENIYLETKVTGLKDTGKKVKVSLEGAKAPASVDFEQVLVAVGRKPNTDNIGLEKTGVKIDEAGFIQTDEQCRTTDPRIFAIGDVAGEPMLAHKAMREARVAAEALAGQTAAAFDNPVVPAIVFTDPEIAWVGLTESQAKADARKVLIKKMPWGGSGRAATLGRQDGLTKIIVEPETARVLGVGIVGPRAGDLISEAVLAIEMGAVIDDLAGIIHPHPTLSETIGDVAAMFGLGATH